VRLIGACAAALLVGCTVIGHNPAPADWPTLKVVEHHVSSREMADVCYQYVEVPMWLRLLGANIEGCAIIHFDTRVCDIWVSGDFPDARVLAHEYEHCEGRDHPGTSNLSDAWAAFKKGQPR
jgi:hypothetical protein